VLDRREFELLRLGRSSAVRQHLEPLGLAARTPMPTSNPPRTDANIAAYTVGECKPHDDAITLSEYDPAWPAAFAREAERIRHALGVAVSELEHVGSTSVPGLVAKPVIDVLLVVRDSSDERAYVPALESAGYSLRVREPDWFEHRMFTRSDTALNLHVFSIGCAEIGRMLAFRDRLRAHDADRALYERAKRALAARPWKHVQHYADAKGEVVEEILARAKARS
jgi:GrpB-like predicted nucleotidyltransferase (UPF0157 family)